MNFCPYCGGKIASPEARFCMNCGKSLEAFINQVTINSVPKVKRAYKIWGKGVVEGVASGKILFVDSNLDSYLAKYKASSKSVEKQKVEDARIAVEEYLRKRISELNEHCFKNEAGLIEAHLMMIEDPAMSDEIDEQINISGSAPKAIIDAYEANAQIFESMDDEYFRNRAADMRDAGKHIAKYLFGIKDPEVVGKVIVAGKNIEPFIIEELPDKIAGVILGVDSTTAHAVTIAKVNAIPMIIGVGDAIKQMSNDDRVSLNGKTGEISIY